MNDLLEITEEYHLFRRQIAVWGQISTYVCNIPHLIKYLSPIESHFYGANRPIDNDHITKIRTSQEEQFRETSHYPIVSSLITLGHYMDKYYILDGQHRITVISELCRWNPSYFENVDILVKIYNATSEKDLNSHFIQINQNYTPVSAYYIDVDVKTVIDSVIDKMVKFYGSWYFSTSEKPHRPHMSREMLKTALSTNELVKEHPDADVIFNIIKNYNSFLSLQNHAFFMKSKSDKTVLTAHHKCFQKQPPFYLGMLDMHKWINSAIEQGARTLLAHDSLI